MRRYWYYARTLLGGDFGPMPRYDKTFGDPDATAIRRALDRGLWQEVDAFLSRLTDHNDRFFYLSQAADSSGRPDWLDQWVSAKPGLGLLVRGVHGVDWAWEARGGDWVPMNFGEFQRRLALARSDLERAAQLLPADPAPWASLIDIQRGQQRPLEEGFECFKQARKRCDDHWGAHSSMLQNLCSKWGGSEAMVWNFVEKSTAKALHGSPIHALVPLAMYEDAMARLRHDPKMVDEDYYGTDNMRWRLHMAAVHWQRSPAFKRPRNEAALRNLYAWNFYVARMYSDAHDEFKAIGPYMGLFPWGGESAASLREFLLVRRISKVRSTWTRMPDGAPVNQSLIARG